MSLDHAGEKCAIEPNGGQQVDIQRFLPMFIVKNREAAVGRGGSANVINKDVEAPPFIEDSMANPRRAIGRADVFTNE